MRTEKREVDYCPRPQPRPYDGRGAHKTKLLENDHKAKLIIVIILFTCHLSLLTFFKQLSSSYDNYP